MSTSQTIRKPVQVGIYDNCEYIAQIYADKIIVKTPYVRWSGNTGALADATNTIRDAKVVDAVRLALADDCEDDAWEKIGDALGDPYLEVQSCN